jgi:hypothetical protein
MTRVKEVEVFSFFYNNSKFFFNLFIYFNKF